MDHDKQTFNTQLGQAATIQREDVRGERMERANVSLSALGESLNPIPGDTLKYLGSAAVHVFWNETLEQVFLISQAQPLTAHGCPDVLAQAAIKDLLGTCIEAYGHKRPKLRSGF